MWWVLCRCCAAVALEGLFRDTAAAVFSRHLLSAATQIKHEVVQTKGSVRVVDLVDLLQQSMQVMSQLVIFKPTNGKRAHFVCDQ